MMTTYRLLRRSPLYWSGLLSVLAVPCLSLHADMAARVAGGAAQPATIRVEAAADEVIRPFLVDRWSAETASLRLHREPLALARLREAAGPLRVALPVTPIEEVVLELTPFTVLSPKARFVKATPDGVTDLALPEVTTLRGRIAGEPGSHVYLTATAGGAVNGLITRGHDRQLVISTDSRNAGPVPVIHVHQPRGPGRLPEAAAICGVEGPHDHDDFDHRVRTQAARLAGPVLGGPRLGHVAIEGDQAFVDLFDGDVGDAGDYVIQLMGAVSDIYERDFNVRLTVSFVRLWPFGGEPFSAQSLSGFRDYWHNNEDWFNYNLIHMLSGRRDTPYGGVAYVSGVCSGFAFGINAYLNGSFPSPVENPDLGNWDIVVVAHEMGHNMGTFHTHDGYAPPIDQCGSGVWSRSTIMSYCHITQGGLLNTDLRFHARVQAEVATVDQSCMAFDCNGNGQDDALDILQGISQDVNGNGIPDECEDCNNNGILDSDEIAGGAPDVNGNGIPDECEADCNGNGIPDTWEIALGMVADLNGNLIPDHCEPDCDGNGIADFAEIASGAKVDYDRNGVPDVCQDCNGNGITDWIDMERQFNIYLGEFQNFIREYHADSGVAIVNRAAGVVSSPYDMAFGADRQLYVSSFGNSRVVRIDVDTGATSTFVAAGSGGLGGPTGLAFADDGHLVVASSSNSSVLKFDGATGAFLETLVSSGSGGLTMPQALAFGPNGNLFVAGGDNRVLEYDGSTGAFVGVFVNGGPAGLDGPRGMVFTPDGRLLVTSHFTNNVLQFAPDGSPLGQFNDAVVPTRAWGITLGPNGNVYVVRHTGDIRILEYDVNNGRYARAFIRGDGALSSPSAIAFRPASPLDCNGNRILDECDLLEGIEEDCNANGVPDSCEIAESGDCNNNSILDACECIAATAPQIEPADQIKNRYISFVPPGDACRVALRVTLTDLPAGLDDQQGTHRWVGAPEVHAEPPGGTFFAAPLTCTPEYRSWGDVDLLHVFGQAIMPGGTYTVQAIHEGCSTVVETDYSAGLGVFTVAQWGDVVAPFNPPDASAQPDIVDISALVSKFGGSATAPIVARADLAPAVPNHVIDITDISAAVGAFNGNPYPFGGPAACP